jgi:aspartyl-tRNA(Asn)/glutamyl-tRNA(Gln) amidotransferase subunit A
VTTALDLERTSAGELAHLLQAGELSSVEVTRAYLERIGSLDPTLHSFITVTADRALEEAAHADRLPREARAARPLHGVPYAVKDLFDTAGFRTTAGSRVFGDRVARADAAAVARLAEAGAVLLGKTNLTEFAVAPEDEYPYGEPRNPWDTTRVPGASSGGSAIAVAASLAAFALGSDTGGSSRGPAAHCGIVGLRPTWGAIDTHGMVPSSWSTDTVGPMARSVDDCALVFGVLAGQRDRMRGDLRGVRAAVVAEWLDPAGTDPEVLRAIEEAIRVFASHGATIERVSFPRARDAAATFTILSKSDAAFTQRELVRSGAPHGTHFRRQMLAASLMPAHVLQKAQRMRGVIRTEFRALLDRYEVVLSPTAARPAEPLWHIGEIRSLADARRSFTPAHIPRHAAALAATPALSSPCGATATGLPIGLQLQARRDGEGELFAIARVFERATKWHERRPALRVEAL